MSYTLWNFLSSSLLFWEIAGYISTVIVIVGCVGEYIADFTRIPKSDEQKRKLSRLALTILTAGIAGELLTAIQSSRISAEVIASLENSVTSSKLSAQEAADAASRAKIAADGAEAKAETVGKEAEQADERVAAVGQRANELAYVLSARRVQDTDGLESDFREEYKGQPITFDSYVGDEEAYWLCSQLAQIAQKAGVASKNGCATRVLSRQLPITDLHIDAPNLQEAERLAKILKKPGRVPGIFVGFNLGPEFPELVVTIGVKSSVPLLPRASNGKTSIRTNAKQ